MNTKRSGKFYYKNEKETLKALGLQPVPGSGSGWIAKEDGENDVALVQLKSTDSSSYRLDMLDMQKLEYHASVSRKVPIFLVQFLKQDKVYAIISVDEITSLFEALNYGEVKQSVEISEPTKQIKAKPIKTSKNARTKFFEERDEQFAKRK